MSRVIQIQTNFSIGELDPLLRGRVDLQQYYNALQQATNVLIQPQGGVKRRDGLKYIAEIPSSASPADGVRLIPFEFSVDDSYMFALAHQKIFIFRAGALVTNINGSGNNYLAVSSITSAMLSKIRYAQNADTIIFVHEDLAPLKIVRGANHSTWTASAITFKNDPQYAFTISTSNPSATITPDKTSGNVKITASSSVFSSGNVGQYINVTSNYGRLRIVEYESGTVVKCRAEINLFDTVAVSASSWELETGYEDAWSSSKGYPVSVTFHEGRLFFGGAKSLPTTFWGSVVNDYFNFELGEGLDDQSVTATITTESLNAIVDVFSGRDLQFFTTGGEFYVPQTTDDPITPSNLAVRVGTRNGIKPGVPVAGLDSGTIYVQRSGKSLNEMSFTDTEQAYNTANISLLSSHLLSTPTDMAMRRSTSTEETDRLFVVNSGDGSMSVYSILRSQNVIAPSKFTTNGTFLAVGVDVDTTYTIVKRVEPTTVTSTVTVTDYANIAVGTKLTFTKNDGTVITLEFESAGGTSPSASVGNTHYVRANASNDTTADNIYTALNAVSGLTVANPGANVVSVVRDDHGALNWTVTTEDSTRLAVTDFTGVDKYFVEIFDNTLHMDSAVYVSGVNTTGTTAHLPYFSVDIINDGNVEAQQVTNASGVVTFTRSTASYYEQGLPFSVSIKTMPVQPSIRGASSAKGFKKRILEVNADLYQSKSMTVNDQLVPFRAFGESVLDQPVQAFTGIKQIGPLLGYDREGSITITQSAPLELNVLALDYKVSLGA